MFEKHGVPVLAGVIATTPEEARAAAEQIGRSAASPSSRRRSRPAAAARPAASRSRRAPTRPQAAAEAILGMDIKGHTVGTVMIAQGARIAEEYYFSVLLDRANRTYLAHGSQGGRHGDRAARRRAPRGARARRGRPDHRASTRPRRSEIVDAAGFDDARQGRDRRRPRRSCGTVYREEDATLVEVNPLVKTEDGDIVALDGKVSLDENADFRHADHEALEDKAAADPLEAAAKEKDLNYVKLDGSVGIIGNGAGLVMSTLDVVAYAGEEFGGAEAGQLPRHRWRRLAPRSWPTAWTSSSATRRSRASSSTSSAASPPATRSPTASSARSTTLGDEATKPLVVRLDGNNVEEGRAILAGAQPPARDASSRHDGRRRRTAAELAAAADPSRDENDNHGDLPQRGLQGHRPGHDRLRGHEAHRSACSSPAPTSSAASTRARPARRSTSRAASPSRSSAPSRRPSRPPAPTCR